MEIQKQLDHASDNIHQIVKREKIVEDDTKLESTILLNVFPEELWLQILKKIFHPDDLQHLRESSKLFTKLFQNMKTKVLFPAVLKIIFGKRKLQPTETQSLLLNCRQVCRTWELGVNSVLDSIFNYNSLIDGVVNSFSLDPETALGCTIPFKNISKVLLPFIRKPSNFLQRFDKSYAVSNRNLFLTRSVRICYINRTDDIKDTAELLPFFMEYGHNISHLCVLLHTSAVGKYSSDFNMPSNIWSYERLEEFLQLMPNLNVLEVCCSARESEDEVEDLKLMMKSFVFPELKMLKHLHLLRVPKPVFAALLRSYSHVSMLSITPDLQDRGFKSSKALYTQHMPNLTDLSFCLESNKKLAWLETSNVMWPLKALFVEIGTFKFDWQKFFEILETRWAGTLTELKIDVNPFQQVHMMQELPSLKLPKLKVLVFFTKNFVPLDFMLELNNSLEYLVFRYSYNVERMRRIPLFQNEKFIKFYEFRTNNMGSNIWQLFPKLNTVQYSDSEVGKTFYHRK